MNSLILHSVKNIWQQAPHNAFTDLIAFNGALWCVFREGSDHVSPDGAFRILQSSNGDQWHSVALISMPHADLRDAKFSLTPAGTLLLLGAGVLHDKTLYSHQSYIWQSDDGICWSEAQPVGEQNIWLWRMIWQQKLYAVGYKVDNPDLSGFITV